VNLLKFSWLFTESMTFWNLLDSSQNHQLIDYSQNHWLMIHRIINHRFYYRFSLSLHRQSYKDLVFTSRFID
jgi:hypothetical protein